MVGRAQSQWATAFRALISSINWTVGQDCGACCDSFKIVGLTWRITLRLPLGIVAIEQPDRATVVGKHPDGRALIGEKLRFQTRLRLINRFPADP
jgi:hypothetical protein